MSKVGDLLASLLDKCRSFAKQLHEMNAALLLAPSSAAAINGSGTSGTSVPPHIAATTLNKSLCLSVIRFVRTALMTKDDFYIKQILKAKLFDKIVDLLVMTGENYNLINR
jgi:hypothetical protein